MGRHRLKEGAPAFSLAPYAPEEAGRILTADEVMQRGLEIPIGARVLTAEIVDDTYRRLVGEGAVNAMVELQPVGS